MDAATPFPGPALTAALRLRGFKVYRSNIPKSHLSAFGRRHYFKIVLSIGKVAIHYGDRIMQLDGAHLFLANNRVPYAAEILSDKQTGYACVFTESFIRPLERLESLQQSPLFKTNGIPTFSLNKQQQKKISDIFENMIAEEATDYSYKDDLMRNYIQLIIHEALRLQPTEHFTQFSNASLRVTTRFLELLERQFPIDNMDASLQLKTAQDFANKLSIHVNYLNRSIRETTGKPTTVLIAERIVTEASALLQHTDWSVADIAYALGFEYSNYFSHFFKKATGHTPSAYRARKV